MESSGPKQNLILLIGGGHAAGKKSVALCIQKDFEALPEFSAGNLEIEVLDMNQYMDSSAVEPQAIAQNSAITVGQKHYLDLKPSRFNFVALRNYVISRTSKSGPGTPKKLIIVHGLYALYDKELCDMSHMKIYIDSDADTRLVRWIRRDVLSKGDNGASLESIINLYLHGAKQEMEDYIFPTKERADVIMPRGFEANGVALLVDGLLSFLGAPKSTASKSVNTLRPFANEKFDNQKGSYYDIN